MIDWRNIPRSSPRPSIIPRRGNCSWQGLSPLSPLPVVPSADFIVEDHRSSARRFLRLSIFFNLFVEESSERSREEKENHRRAEVLVETQKRSDAVRLLLVELGDRVQPGRAGREEASIEQGDLPVQPVEPSDRGEDEMEGVRRAVPTEIECEWTLSHAGLVVVVLPVGEDGSEEIVHQQMAGPGQGRIEASTQFDGDVRHGDEFVPADETIAHLHLRGADRLHSTAAPPLHRNEVTRRQTETSAVRRRERVERN